ncbi:MAG: two-component regulator propeller domain-containing protein [Balneolaceae bacterium]
MIQKYTVKDGLPINSVNYMTHHSDGFIYLATNDGLVKFDGLRFTTYTSFNYPELKSNRIDWVGSGANDEVWFTDVSDRIYSLKNGTLVNFDIEGELAKKVEILSTKQTLITTNSGFLIQREANGKFERFADQKLNQKFINSFVFKGTEIFFLLEDGLYQMKDEEAQLLLNKNEMLLKPNEIFNMIKTKDESLWFLGFSNQLLEVSVPEKQELYSYSNEKDYLFWDFIEKGDSLLVISTDKGYLEFDRLTHSFSETEFMLDSQGYFEDNAWMFYSGGTISKLGSDIYIDQKKVLETERRITFLTMDQDSSIWVATSGGGVYQIKQKKMITIGGIKYPNLRNLYGLTEKDNDLFVASFESNIFRISENEIENWNRERSNLKDIFFRSVSVDKEGIVWAGNFNLWSLRDNKWERDKTYVEDENQIDLIFEDSQNRFWVGTNRELFIRNGTGFIRFKDEDGESLYSATSVQEKTNGVLIFTTTGQGLAILDSSNRFKFLDMKVGLSSNLIRDVYIASEDTLWVVTEDKGLNRVVHNSEFEIEEIKQVTTNDGLIDNSLHRLIDDEKGYFWINSNKGIMRVNERILNRYLDGFERNINIEVFGEEDGLLNIEGNGGSQNAGILTKDGNLLFPNQAGLIFTKPEWHINEEDEYFPLPVFEFINYSGSEKSLLGQQRYSLPLGVRSLSVKFALPYFSKPSNVELEYLMEDVNQQWQNTGVEQMAVFTNLSAGSHKLRVRGHLKGTSKFEEETLELSIPPYFYETSWFILFASVLTLALLILIFRLLLRQARNREKKLNDIVFERTQDLLIEKEKTEDALIRIEELSNAKSRFFTNFTHELRTPLSLILNPIEDMLNNNAAVSSNGEGSLRLMKRNAIRLKELVNRLLDISKLNSKELTFRFQKIDIIAVTKQITHQFEHEFERKNISLSINDNTELREVFTDINAWEHICVNLLSNALKFTPKKGSIEISINEREQLFEVLIKDSGIGISKEELPFIFDPYFQGNSSISKAEGTGIGLALVNGLVKNLYGMITVNSELGKWTEFKITLKKGVSHLSEEIILSESEEIGSSFELEEPVTVFSSVNNLIVEEDRARALLVEDNDDFREYLQSVISSKYEVRIAENGIEGLEVIKSFQPDIIISDIMMPEMDGYEMMKSIRSMPAFKHIPFIFLSAKDSAVDIETGLNVGADIYLTKPVQNNVLLTQIKVLLRREQELRKEVGKKEQGIAVPLISKVKEIIQRHLGNPDLNVELIANALSMSSATLYRNWKSVSEETINTVITRSRFEEAIKLIKEEKLTISEASYLVGFKQLSYFSRAFKKMYGVSPQEYLKNN